MTEPSDCGYSLARFEDAGAELVRLREQSGVVAAAEEAIFRRLGLPDAGSVLDVGCGPGFVAGRLKASHPSLHIIGVDSDVELLRRVPSPIEVVHARAENLPFESDAFACAYARLVLRHLAHPEAALAEMFRVLTPGGIAIAVDSDDGALVLYPQPIGFARLLEAKQQTARRRGADPFIGRRLTALMRGAGFTAIRAHTLALDSITLGGAAFAQIVLSPFAGAIDPDLLSPEQSAAWRNEIRTWAERPDAFGMTTAIAIGATKPLGTSP